MVNRADLYPGVRVRIIDSWDELPEDDRWENPSGKMDGYLGTVMTVRRVLSDGWIRMVEDAGDPIRKEECWVWKENAFVEIVSDNMDNIDPSCDDLYDLLGLE